MRAFLVKLAAFFATHLVAVGVLLGLTYRPAEQRPYYRSTVLKHERLREAPGPRLILVGGSNLPFGIHSETLRELTGLEPVNMGLHAGLPLEFMLSEVEPWARDGDLVALCLEYRVYQTRDARDAIPTVMLVVEQRSQSVAALPVRARKPLLDMGVQHQALTAIRRPILRDAQDRADITARWIEFNEFGDEIGHRGLPPEPDALASVQIAGLAFPENTRASAEVINGFADRLAERGASVVVSFPPVPRSHHELRRAVIEGVESVLRETLRVPVLGEPEGMTFDDGLFFDTPYHLTGLGGAERTRRLVELISGR